MSCSDIAVPREPKQKQRRVSAVGGGSDRALLVLCAELLD